MNIAILTDRYFPTPVSGAVLMHDLALELVSQKHNVLVVLNKGQNQEELHKVPVKIMGFTLRDYIVVRKNEK